MEIRSATPADRDTVIGLWEACDLTRPWNDPVADFERALAGPTSTVLVADADDEIVASAMVGDDGHRGWVYYLAVRPDLQGAGRGRAMMAACEAWLLARGCPKVELMVRDENVRVLEFYERLGYRRDAVLVLGHRLQVR